MRVGRGIGPTVWIWKGNKDFSGYQFMDEAHAFAKLGEASAVGWAEEYVVVQGRRRCPCCEVTHSLVGNRTGRRFPSLMNTRLV